jgi:hypothetical protein
MAASRPQARGIGRINALLVKQESTEGSACLSITVEIESKSIGFMVQLNSSERLRVNYSDEIGPSKIEVY